MTYKENITAILECYFSGFKKEIIDSDETGTITKVYPPCAEHSGRFIAYIHAKYRSYYTEFRYSDINESVRIIHD